MGFEPLFFAALALALGFKHAFDADHVVAVSNLLTRKSVERALGLSVTWAAGHMVTAAAVSMLVYFFAETLLPLSSRFEILVPVMLVVIGVVGLFAEYRRIHVHRHAHLEGGHEHAHVHSHFKSPRHEHGAMAGIGFVHGLASNDELLIVLLVGLGASSVWQVLLGVALFSVGVVVGMSVYALGMSLASAGPKRAAWLPSAITIVLSLASIAYAAYLFAGGEGLNLLDRWVDLG